MNRLSRRQILGGAAMTAAAVALDSPSVQAQKRGPTLRFVAEADLKILDPVWTTGYITRNHGYLVYDTLFGTDENHQIKPQMVDRTTVSEDGMKYTFTLRDGLRWHDGQPVHSEDCVASLQRWGKRDRFGRLLMAHTGKITPVDQKTFTLELAERFGPVLEALGKPSSNVPFMMPARIASTPADEQITEVVGSGPFKFVKDEWKPGHQVVYVRNTDYVPRNEAPSGSTGGKKVYLDKVIWQYIPDPWSAAEALAAGEVDWWQEPPLDYLPKIEQNPDLQTFLFDPLGTQGWLRPNHLQPPFSNRKAREALLHMMDQVTYLALAIGPPRYYRSRTHERCGARHASATGVDRLQRHPQGNGLVNVPQPSLEQGSPREGRLEHIAYLVYGSRRAQSCRPFRCVGCGPGRLVRVARRPATRQARDRLGTRDRSGETEADRGGGSKGCLARSHLCSVGRMVPADGIPKECAGRSQVHRAGLLECEDHIGKRCRVGRPPNNALEQTAWLASVRRRLLTAGVGPSTIISF